MLAPLPVHARPSTGSQGPARPQASPTDTRPSARPHTIRASSGLVILLGALLGLAGERLITGPGGLGFTVWVALLGLAALALLRRSAPRLLPPIAGWAGTALLAALLMLWHDGPAVLLPLLLALALTAALALLRAAGTDLRACRSLDLLLSGCLLPVRAGGGILPLMASAPRPAPGRLRALAGWGRGLLLALPLLILFGALFAAADQRFNSGLHQLAALAPDLPEHLAAALALGWISTGLLAGLLPEAPWRPQFSEPIRLRLGREETVTVLGLLCLLFLLFVGLQLPYLFGGPAYISEVPGLTVAAYARRGFFELLAVALLSLALLLILRPLAEPRAFRLLGRVLTACVLLLLVSALQRLWLYVDSFGLSVSRVAALAVLAWVATSLLLFLGTVLRGRPRGFAGGSALLGLAVALCLALANPEGLVARVNLDRMQSRLPAVGGPVPESSLAFPALPSLGLRGNQANGDLAYLLRLGPDAVPPLLAALPKLPLLTRCQIAAQLLNEWGPAGRRHATAKSAGWRGWHLARARALAAVEARLPELIAQEVPCLAEGWQRRPDGSF